MHSLLEHELAVAVFEAVKPRQKLQPQEIVPQGVVRQHQRGDIAKLQAADFHHIEPGRRCSDRGVGGLHLSDKSIARRANTETGGVARSQRNDRRASIDDKVDAAAIDTAIDVKMALGVARNDDQSRARILGRGRRRPPRLRRRGGRRWKDTGGLECRRQARERQRR